MFYVLRNEELGYIANCPTFEFREDAEEAAADKCRRHSVIEVEDIKPCVPTNLHSGCLRCGRCAATIERRMKYLNEHNSK